MLNNNSSEMKTVVETYIIEETAELIYDNEKLEAWNKHVNELGLEGQTKIVKKEKSPIPFLFMNQQLVKTFETLCPAKKKINDYDLTPIPVEILSLVSLSVKEKYFDFIEIWYDDKTPDPCCIGKIYPSQEYRDKGYSWGMHHYLIGRWSDVKQSFQELKARAIARFKESEVLILQKEIKDATRRIEDLDNITFDSFGSITLNQDLPF